VTLLTNENGDAVIRVIAARSARSTARKHAHPITLLHVSLLPGGQLVLPWNPSTTL